MEAIGFHQGNISKISHCSIFGIVVVANNEVCATRREKMGLYSTAKLADFWLDSKAEVCLDG